MKVSYQVVHAFSLNNAGGNAAAIVLDADGFDNQAKQQIAAKIGFSETAFVSKSKSEDFKLDFFTPVRQIAHCGHATIAAFHYLRALGRIPGKNYSSKETIDGPRQIRFSGDEPFMEQKKPVIGLPDPADEALIYQSLALQPDLIHVPTLVYTGNRFLILEVNNGRELQELEPDFPLISRLSEKYGLVGFYLFYRPGGDVDATTRMFAPYYGIEEESATGMAAGPLAGYLYAHGLKKTHYRIEQGRFMSPAAVSLIKVDMIMSDGEPAGLFAGGSASVVSENSVEL